MNAKEYLSDWSNIPTDTDYGAEDLIYTRSEVLHYMTGFLAHKIEEAEKANPYKSDSSSGHGIEAKLIEHGYNLALNKLKEL